MTLKLQPRRLTPCHRHPDQPHTSLCAPCLRERLSHLSPSSSSAAATGLSAAGACSSSSAPALPELRRSKTFSADKCESLGLGLPYDQPRRRSCEVRSRSSLEDLLTADDDGGGAGPSTAKCKVESKNLGLLRGTYPVPELREEDDEEDESDCEIRVSADVTVPDAVRLRAGDLDLDESIEEDSKTIKEFIDLEFERNKPVRRDFKEIAGSFWIAASVFSKKLQKWKGKQKSGRPDGDCDTRRHSTGGGLGEMRLDKLRGRRLRDAQPEAGGDCGFGRRSCDSDPRFSIDIGRASIDGGRISVDGIGKRFFDTDPRFSLDLGRASVDCGRIPVEEARQGCFDAPRASWDGYMNGRMVPRGATPMVSVIENAMATVYGFDNRALIENEDNRKSYGGIVARHLDSVSLHVGKKGADQCSSKTNVEEDEKAPGRGVEIFHGTKLLITEKELMDSRMSSLKDDSSDSFDTASKDMTSSASSSSTGIGSRKSRKWGKLLNVWSLLSRQKQTNAESTVSDPSKRVEREGNEEEVSSDPNWKLTRSHSVASSRSLYKVAGSALGMKGETEAKSLSLKNGGLERNRSARYSPNNVQNGMLRFYLTPLRSARQKKLGKNRLSKCHSSGRAVSREEIRKDPPTTNVQVFYQDLNTGIEYCKTFAIGPDESAKDCVKIALDHLEMRDVDPSQYQLWAKTPREEPPYLLFGHEKPYSVKLSCLRDGLSAEEGFDLDHCNNVHDPLARCHFILRSVKAQENETNKKTPKKSSGRMKIGQVFKKTPTKENGGNLFGVPLNRICDGENLPKPVMGMLHQIFSKGPFTQGIFRKSANARLVRELREKMDVCEDVCLENVPVLVTAALFKDMLRSLPDPLLCTSLFPKWRSALDCSNLPTKLFRIKTIIDQLPRPNYHLLCHFLCVLYHISRRSTHNLMSAANLGVCVGPSLLWSDSPAMCPTEDLRTVPALVEILITHCELLCGPHVPNLLGDPRDSGTEESDSMRRDDSSIDSLEVSPPPRKDQISLSRDSGLTLSDSQLYTPDEEESGSTSSSGYDPAFDQAHSAKTPVASPAAPPSMPGEYVRVYPGWEERKNANFQRQAWFRQRSKRLTAAASKEAVRRSASEESVLDGGAPPPTPPRRSKPVQMSGNNNNNNSNNVNNNNNNNRISLAPPQQEQYRKMTAADYYDVVVKSEVVVESLHPNNYSTELTIKPVAQPTAYRAKDDSQTAAAPVDRRRYHHHHHQQQQQQQQQQLTAAVTTATVTTATAAPAVDCCKGDNDDDSSTLSDEDCTPHVSRSNSRGDEVAADSLKLRQHQPPVAHADGTVRLRGRLKRKEEKAAVAAARSRSLPPPPPYRPPPPANRRAPITSYYLGECSQAQQQRFVVTRAYADEESYV